jgi:hypothetical protein
MIVGMAKRPTDINQLAKFIVDQATGNVQPDVPDVSDDERKAAARILGRMGGLKGGPARKNALSKARRVEIAQKAARKRWKNERAKKGGK